MIAIAVAAIGVNKDSLDFASPKVLSDGLSSVAGTFAPYFFGIGLIAASFIALIVISLGSSWVSLKHWDGGERTGSKYTLSNQFRPL